ncbi:MAG: hypothetical protein F6K16_17570 [Symploca sp. SIO2B6]|nr:hypothetical protein [Symploca sp. SIO2B6]
MNAIERLKMTGLFALMVFCCSIWLPYNTIQLFFGRVLGALILALATWLILSTFRKYYVTNQRLIITGLFTLMGFCRGSLLPLHLFYGFKDYSILLLVAGLLEALTLGLASWLIFTVFRNCDWTDMRWVMIRLFALIGFCGGSTLPFALTIGSTPLFIGGLLGALILSLPIWLISETSKVIKYCTSVILCLVVAPHLLIFNSPQSLYDCASVGNIFLGGFECYYRPNPIIDTIVPPEFSEKKFFSIKPGMDVNEVIALLGQPKYPYYLDEKVIEYGEDGAVFWWDFAWMYYRIWLDDNYKVTETYRDIHYN